MFLVEANKLKIFIATKIKRKNLKYNKFIDFAIKIKAKAMKIIVKLYLEA